MRLYVQLCSTQLERGIEPYCGRVDQDHTILRCDGTYGNALSAYIQSCREVNCRGTATFRMCLQGSLSEQRRVHFHRRASASTIVVKFADEKNTLI